MSLRKWMKIRILINFMHFHLVLYKSLLKVLVDYIAAFVKGSTNNNKLDFGEMGKPPQSLNPGYISAPFHLS